jgi:hypothetical protein
VEAFVIVVEAFVIVVEAFVIVVEAFVIVVEARDVIVLSKTPLFCHNPSLWGPATSLCCQRRHCFATILLLSIVVK